MSVVLHAIQIAVLILGVLVVGTLAIAAVVTFFQETSDDDAR
ncbi:hypothetical protein SEA_SIXAMA_57 [Gordonia phage Sixama]|uniref:Uncharacterized protein n=1 Tax=Gordonia phage Sixama TaxID=2653271 RepID=A0A5Q2F7W6_9CAUD|nr:hypothetical protein PP302_gp057 [Gordonia phage Sixama]QGF20236.1 hypothetical protein SEA_SIXAMA_57 [Gordonia phage Sixama]